MSEKTFNEKLADERLVMNQTGLSRREVRKLGEEKFEEIRAEAAAEKESRTTTIKGAKYDKGDADREKILEGLRTAKATGSGTKISDEVPTTLQIPVPAKQKPTPQPKPTEDPVPIVDNSESGLANVLPSAANGAILVNYGGVWAGLPNPGAGEWVLVHEGDTPYWKALTACEE